MPGVQTSSKRLKIPGTSHTRLRVYCFSGLACANWDQWVALEEYARRRAERVGRCGEGVVVRLWVRELRSVVKVLAFVGVGVVRGWSGVVTSRDV